MHIQIQTLLCACEEQKQGTSLKQENIEPCSQLFCWCLRVLSSQSVSLEKQIVKIKVPETEDESKMIKS